VANPGYFPNHDTKEQRNVVNLGALPHPEVIAHVRSALCVLHLNAVFPETFGIVHAEANAVGTPFLSSRLGAVPETADHPSELIDVNDTKAVIDRLIAWKRGRPKVRGNPMFRLNRIVKEWLDLFSL
jgi:glycosyltransferase involved in cell wall biosynthesis